MITKFSRKRVQKPGVTFQKNFTRIQVDGNTLTFKSKKTVSQTGYSPKLDFSYNNNSMYISIFPI